MNDPPPPPRPPSSDKNGDDESDCSLTLEEWEAAGRKDKDNNKAMHYGKNRRCLIYCSMLSVNYRGPVIQTICRVYIKKTRQTEAARQSMVYAETHTKNTRNIKRPRQNKHKTLGN